MPMASRYGQPIPASSVNFLFWCRNHNPCPILKSPRLYHIQIGGLRDGKLAITVSSSSPIAETPINGTVKHDVSATQRPLYNFLCRKLRPLQWQSFFVLRGIGEDSELEEEHQLASWILKRKVVKPGEAEATLLVLPREDGAVVRSNRPPP
jgi:hypothetical protein